ncbi:MAG: hypothetical protein BZ136_00220 [Methanosphaera sp. rholeuAM74]|nr:MAG: hypothetical protein BZ136_00220 [Methanosphaera sp. rholeuAM74]
MTTDYFKFEDEEYDLPLLNDDPRFTAENVVILIIGFLIASAIPYLIPSTGNGLIKAVLITIPPLLAVLYVFKDDMSNIFRMPKPRDIIVVIIGFILMLAVAMIADIIGSTLGIASLADNTINGSPLVLIICAVIQLLGEELIKFIPLIIITAYLYKSIGRKAAIIVAIIISQVLFALFHIPYGFAIGSLLLHIGFGSTVLPFVYVKTKNLVLCYMIFLSKFMVVYAIHILGI